MGDSDDRIGALADLALERGLRVAVAESLTSGALSSRLGAAPQASEWFLGGLVAYHSTVKQSILDVPPGPVVTAACAEQMARGVRRVLGSDVAVATTGVGGPEPSEGRPAGTVFVAVATEDRAESRELALPGGPEDVIDGTVDAAVGLLLEVMAAPLTA